MNHSLSIESKFLAEVKALIHTAKQNAVVAVNIELTLLYWKVGKRIAEEILGGERAEYGKQVMTTLAQQLTLDYGRGWSTRNLEQMVKFSQVFPDFQITQTLSAQLSWSHFKCLVPISDPLKREFYLAMALQERWSTRTLSERIDSQLFERTAISKKPELTIIHALHELREKGQFSQNLVLKDPISSIFWSLMIAMWKKILKTPFFVSCNSFY